MSQVVTPTNLGTSFELGSRIANKITIRTDDTSVVQAADGTISAASPVYDNTAKTITFPAVNGAAPVVIDLTQFTTDIFVNGGSFDGSTQILTLTDNDGVTPDVTVDLSSLLGVSTDAGNLLTDGADGKPFFNKAALDAQTAICTDAFGSTNLFRGITI